ncbi:MAG TPA: F-box protein, partial [Alphaproteobacteria bacterium]|nr:F-box protein [Alphaproteobacteria bacterium]
MKYVFSFLLTILTLHSAWAMDQEGGAEELGQTRHAPSTLLDNQESTPFFNFKSSITGVELPEELAAKIVLLLPPSQIARVGRLSKRFYALTRSEYVWRNAWVQVGLSDAPYPFFRDVNQQDVAERGFLIGRAKKNEEDNEAVLFLLPEAEKGDITAQLQIGELILLGGQVKFPVRPPAAPQQKPTIEDINKTEFPLKTLISG